jgi:predicted dehydrogenase
METSRRTFLKNTGMAVAASLSVPYILQSCSTGRSPNGRVNLAFIGMGGRGQSLLRQFMLLDGVQVVAICDAFANRREDRTKWVNEVYAKRADVETYASCTAYGHYDQILERKDIDGVVIATPDHWHVPLAYAAVQSGKDVYVEKPLGLSIEQGQKLRALVRKKKAIFQYGTQQRSDEKFRKAAELVVNGVIGKLDRIDAWCPGKNRDHNGETAPAPIPSGFDYDLWLGPAPYSHYTVDRCTSEGAWFIYDNAIGFVAGWGAHPLDIAQWGNQSDDSGPGHFEGTGTLFPPEGLYDTIDAWDVKCRYANGVDMHFFSHDKIPDYVEGKRNNITNHGTTFWGSDGWVSVDRGTLEASNTEWATMQFDEDKQLYVSDNHYKNFVDCIRSRKDPVCTIDAAVRSDTISHLCDMMIRSGERTIEWDPVNEQLINPPVGIERMLHRPQMAPYDLV